MDIQNIAIAHKILIFVLKMIVKNKIEKPFGPSGTTMGLFLFVVGIGITFFSLVGGIIFIIVGGFVGFTSTITLVDSSQRRVKYATNIFGTLPIGKWVAIEDGMKLGLKKSHQGFRIYTRANSMDIHIQDIRIMLFGLDNKPILPVNTCDSIESAKSELEKLSNQLKLGII